MCCSWRHLKRETLVTRGRGEKGSKQRELQENVFCYLLQEMRRQSIVFWDQLNLRIVLLSHGPGRPSLTTFTLHLLCQKGCASSLSTGLCLLCHHCSAATYSTATMFALPPLFLYTHLLMHTWVSWYAMQKHLFYHYEFSLVVNQRGKKKRMPHATIMLMSLWEDL